MSDYQRSGAAEACWAHNPKVEGSKPSSAISISFSEICFIIVQTIKLIMQFQHFPIISNLEL